MEIERGVVVQLGDEAYKRVVDNLHEGLYFVDRNRVITYWNKAAERITGYSAAEVVGSACHDNILNHIDGKGHQLCFGLCPLAATMEDRDLREAEVYLHHKNGHRVPVSVRTSALADDTGEVIGGIELFADISNSVANQLKVQELEELAYIDALTRLANRSYLDSELGARLEEHRRYGVPFGILFMDIDHFKSVNDTYGHDVGDKVLQMVANTFSANSRPFDTFGRWGGEEFIGVLRNVEGETLAILGNRIREAVAGAYLTVEGETLQVTVSIGATMVLPEDSRDSLIQRADRGLYASKQGGRNRLTYVE